MNFSKFFLVFLIITAVTTDAMAQQEGLFFGLDLSQFKMELQKHFSLTTSAHQFSAQYQFGNDWYTALNYSSSLSDPSLLGVRFINPLPTSDASGLPLTYSLQLLSSHKQLFGEPLDLYGRLGATYTSTMSCQGLFENTNHCLSSFNLNQVGDMNYGIGLRYHINDNIGIKGEWEHLKLMNTPNANQIMIAPVNRFSVGVGFKF